VVRRGEAAPKPLAVAAVIELTPATLGVTVYFCVGLVLTRTRLKREADCCRAKAVTAATLDEHRVSTASRLSAGRSKVRAV